MIAKNLGYVGELGRTVAATEDGAMIAMTKEMAAGLHALLIHLLEEMNPAKLPRVFETLRDHIHADPMYAWSWHCNIAMASVDEGMARDPANFAAARFMHSCFGVDTSKNEHFNARRDGVQP